MAYFEQSTRERFARKGRGKKMYYDNSLYIVGICIKEDVKHRMFIVVTEEATVESVIKTLYERHKFNKGLDDELGLFLTSYYSGRFYDDYDISFIGKIPVHERDSLDEFIESRDRTYRNLDRFDNMRYKILAR